MLIDARTVSPDQVFDCDLAVVGSGPAGVAIVDRLRDSKLSVVLLESGGFNYDLTTQRLYQGEITGDPYFRLDACRWRMFGGSSNRWGGWCRPLEPVDFDQRDWLAHSGWPIGAQVLKPYEADAAQLFQLAGPRFDIAEWRNRLPEPFALDGTHFQNIIFQHSPETNFGEVYRSRLLAAPNITVMLYANVTDIRLDTGSQRVSEVQVATLTGRRFAVRPKAVVLAAGGIENARILLASRNDRPAGLGNEFDLVGRFFMEHLHVPLGHLLAAPGAGSNGFFDKAVFREVRLRGVITPTPAAQEQYRLLAASIAFEDSSYYLGTPFVGWPPPVMYLPVRAYQGLRHRGLNRTADAAKILAHRAFMLPNNVRTWMLARRARAGAGAAGPADRMYSLYVRGEQAPDPNNRVMLSERRDALGVPESRLDWRVRPVDAAALTGWFEVLDRDMRARGLGRLIKPPESWQGGIVGGPHHMGTTRMSSDARRGVVDADCRVHSVGNLYVAGSSVFTTGGYANPTFTLVTLALRLADTLRERLQSS